MYSDESTASETGRDLDHYFSLLKRKKMVILGWGMVGTLLTLLVFWALPTCYESTATILIEDPEIPPQLIGSTVTTFAEKRLEVIDQRIMTARNLGRIIKEFNLYPELRHNRPTMAAIEQLRADFELEKVNARLIHPTSGRPMSSLVSFNLTYRNRSPDKAQKVTRELARLYLAYNYTDRRNQATDVADFLADEAARLAERVNELENHLTKFKETHPAFVAGQGQVMIDMIDRTEAQIREIDSRISTLNDRKLILTRELEIAEALGDEDNERMSVPQMRARLARISQIYGPDHPDVVLLKRRIASAQNDGSGLAELPMNPAAARVQAQLATIDSEKSRMKDQRKLLEAKLENYEKKALASPQLEQQYLELRRDYENAKNQYDETKRKQLVADQARVLEKSKKSQRFTLLEPPKLPRRPAGPSRELVVAGGFGVFLVLGLMIVLVADLMDDRIHSSRQLQAVLGTEPLMLVPVLHAVSDRRHRRVRASTASRRAGRLRHGRRPQTAA